MQVLLLDPNQTVVRTHIEISIKEGERGYVGGGQSSLDCEPAVRLAFIHIKAVAQRAGEYVARRDQHGIGIDLEWPGGIFERAKVSRAVESEHTCAIRSNHPLAANRDYGRDPVVLESRRSGRVADLYVAFLELRKATQRARHQFITRSAERVHMVIDQPLKCIHAACTGGVEKGQSGRSRQGQAILVR